MATWRQKREQATQPTLPANVGFLNPDFYVWNRITQFNHSAPALDTMKPVLILSIEYYASNQFGGMYALIEQGDVSVYVPIQFIYFSENKVIWSID